MVVFVMAYVGMAVVALVFVLAMTCMCSVCILCRKTDVFGLLRLGAKCSFIFCVTIGFVTALLWTTVGAGTWLYKLGAFDQYLPMPIRSVAIHDL